MRKKDARNAAEAETTPRSDRAQNAGKSSTGRTAFFAAISIAPLNKARSAASENAGITDPVVPVGTIDGFQLE